MLLSFLRSHTTTTVAKIGESGGRGSAALGGIAPLEQSFRHRQAGDLREVLRSMADSANLRAREEAHWKKTTNLMLTHLGIWFFFGYIVHLFVVPLNKIVIPVLGFPLGFYMAAQGSLIVFVVLIFWFSSKQNQIDEEFGVAEED